jgi:hypothetical protein
LDHGNIHWRAFVSVEMNTLVLYTAGSLLTGCVGFEVLMMVFTKISIFWYIKPFSPLKVNGFQRALLATCTEDIGDMLLRNVH